MLRRNMQYAVVGMISIISAFFSGIVENETEGIINKVNITKVFEPEKRIDNGKEETSQKLICISKSDGNILCWEDPERVKLPLYQSIFLLMIKGTKDMLCLKNSTAEYEKHKCLFGKDAITMKMSLSNKKNK